MEIKIRCIEVKLQGLTVLVKFEDVHFPLVSQPPSPMPQYVEMVLSKSQANDYQVGLFYNMILIPSKVEVAEITGDRSG